MRNAGANELKKYLKMRLEDGEIAQEEQKQSRAANLPNSGGTDQWDMLIREFRQGTALDLRNK